MRKFNENYALIRVFHAVPGAPAVDVYLNDKLFFSGLSFTEFTPYIYVPEGMYTLAIYTENTLDDPIINQEVEVKKDELVTIAVVGDTSDMQVLTIKEDKELAEDNKSKVRFIHLVPNVGEVNILLDNEEVFKNVMFKDVTQYLNVMPGQYEGEIELAENGVSIRRDRVNIKPDRIYTFYAVGSAPNIDILQSVDGATFLF